MPGLVRRGQARSPTITIQNNISVKARCAASVAIRATAGGGHINQQYILITIHLHTLHMLRVATGLALDPQLLSGTAPIGCKSCFQRPGERVLIHMRNHDHASAGMVRNDACNQTISAEFGRKFRALFQISDCISIVKLHGGHNNHLSH